MLVFSSCEGELSRLCPLLNIYHVSQKEHKNQIVIFCPSKFYPNTTDLFLTIFFLPFLLSPRTLTFKRFIVWYLRFDNQITPDKISHSSVQYHVTHSYPESKSTSSHIYLYSLVFLYPEKELFLNRLYLKKNSLVSQCVRVHSFSKMIN